MCGRFALSITAGQMRLSFGVELRDVPSPRWNITPDSRILTLGATGVAHARWGLIPPWSRDPKDRARQINARSETVLEKPMFAGAARHRRCIIPATGFYEWQKRDGFKQPWWITHKDRAPLAFAGIYERTALPEGHLESCAILTTRAAPEIADLHHRMPLMLTDAAMRAWLDPDETDPARITGLMQTIPSDLIEAWPVGREVDGPRADHSGLAEPVSEIEEPAQGRLF